MPPVAASATDFWSFTGSRPSALPIALAPAVALRRVLPDVRVHVDVPGVDAQREDIAVAVENRAAWGVNGVRTNELVFGSLRVFRVLNDLQLDETSKDNERKRPKKCGWHPHTASAVPSFMRHTERASSQPAANGAWPRC